MSYPGQYSNAGEYYDYSGYSNTGGGGYAGYPNGQPMVPLRPTSPSSMYARPPSPSSYNNYQASASSGLSMTRPPSTSYRNSYHAGSTSGSYEAYGGYMYPGMVPRAASPGMDMPPTRQRTSSMNMSHPQPIPAHMPSQPHSMPGTDPSYDSNNSTSLVVSPPKRTTFSATELHYLQSTWSQGFYYPSNRVVEEIMSRTNLTRGQVRGWFANRRQRAPDHEKSLIKEAARRMTVAGTLIN